MRQGMLGVRVKIMLKHDPEGKTGPKKPMPDLVIVHEPKVEAPIVQEEETTYADVDTAATGGYDGAGGNYNAGGGYNAGGYVLVAVTMLVATMLVATMPVVATM